MPGTEAELGKAATFVLAPEGRAGWFRPATEEARGKAEESRCFLGEMGGFWLLEPPGGEGDSMGEDEGEGEGEGERERESRFDAAWKSTWTAVSRPPGRLRALLEGALEGERAGETEARASAAAEGVEADVGKAATG